MKKRFVAILLALVMVFGVLPFAAFAEESLDEVKAAAIEELLAEAGEKNEKAVKFIEENYVPQIEAAISEEEVEALKEVALNDLNLFKAKTFVDNFFATFDIENVLNTVFEYIRTIKIIDGAVIPAFAFFFSGAAALFSRIFGALA